MATPDVLQTTSAIAEDFSMCALCQETFKKPKILSCLHTFCCECLNKYISKLSVTSLNRQFPCPSCDIDIDLPAMITVIDGHFAESLKDDQFMAAFVELTKALQDGKYCDICVRSEETVPAVNWCSDCSDALCESCTHAHLHVKVTASHVVQSLEEMRQLPLESLTRKKNKVNCDKHGEQISLFCVDCKEPLCVQCMAVSHRRCENVITVNDALATRKDVDNIMDTLKDFQMSMDSVDNLTKLEQQLEKTIEAAKQEIIYLSNSLCEKIRKQEACLLKSLENMSTESRKILKSRIEPRKMLIKTAKSASQRMNNLSRYGSDVEVMMAFNQIRKQLDEYNNQMDDISPDRLKVHVEFMPEESYLKYLDEIKSIGELHIDTGIDEGISSWGVTCTTREDIIVTDCASKRIQKFSKAGELVDHIQLDDEPRDITTCGVGDDVAVPLVGKLILFIATRRELSLIRKTKTERQYDGISYSSIENYLVVTSMRGKCVDIIQLDGIVLKSFSQNNNGDCIFDQPRYISAAIDGTIVVSDIGQHAVKCINSNGETLFHYSCHNNLKNPQGVCIDKIGNIFVADNSNDRIQLLTSQGVFQRYVLGKESGLVRPCAIMVSSSNRLVIVQNDGMVKVYSYC